MVALAFRGRTTPTCEYCGVSLIRTTVRTEPNRAVGDHRIPISRGGLNIRANVAVVCAYCDTRKGPLTVEEFLSVQHDPAERRRLITSVQAELDRIAEQDPYPGARQRRKSRQRKQRPV